MDKGTAESQSPSATPAPPASTVFDERGRFFRRHDWIAAAVAAVVSLGVYVYTLAPEVTLQDSGEFCTASYNLGVPHPPGYPLWSMLTWLMCRIPVGNVAWRVNLFSALVGALTNGLLALLISRSGASFLDVTPPFAKKLTPAVRDHICLVAGIAGALVFAFSDVMWSQAVIAEVYTLNAFFLVIVMVLMFIWIHQPDELRYLYWAAFWFGLGLTNHQTLAVIFPAFVVIVYLLNRRIFLEYLIACMLVVGSTMAVLAYLSCGSPPGRVLAFCFNPSLPNFVGDGDLVKIASRVVLLFAVISSALVVAIYLRAARDGRLPWRGGAVRLRSVGRLFLAYCGVTAFAYVVAVGAFLRGGLRLAAVETAAAQQNEPARQAAEAAARRLAEVQELATNAALVLSVPLLLVALALGVYLIWRRVFAWRPILSIAAAYWVGLLFYCYMPLASTTNPPMNWGYCRLKEGVYHHITRGQYEGSLPDIVKRYAGRSVMVRYYPPPTSGSPWTLRKYWGQINTYFENLSDNFTLPVCLLALFVFFYYRDFTRKDRAWIVFLLVLFVALVPVMIKLLNPEFDKQTQEIQKVFYILSHAVYAVWVGYGAVFLLGLVVAHARGRPTAVLWAGSAVVLLLPLAPASVNWADCNQRGHLFGYYFGHDMFETHPGLKPLYPPMETNAVLYGGTDPGRFVPTYMIFCESRAPRQHKHPLNPNFDRRDVIIITQNALADNTYMNYIRDHYSLERPDLDNPSTLTNRPPWQRKMFEFGWKYLDRDTMYPRPPIWIPGPKKVEEGFQQYVNELRTRPPQPGENVRIEGGKVSIQGVQGVMAINGIISKMIFDANKDKHAFYVEESYVINWMYPYLEPFQIIMKINKEPLEKLTPEKVARDREFWDQYSAMLKADPRFRRDRDAQKSFSKLRTAVAGLYAWRGATNQPELNDEAEYAFRQALDLCPDSPETNFRYVELLTRLGRFDDAVDVLEKFKKLDPYNQQIYRVLENVQNIRRMVQELAEWEERHRRDPSNFDVLLKLIQLYAQRQRMDLLDRAVEALLQLPQLTTNHIIQLAQMYAQLNRLDRVARMLELLTERAPTMAAAWYDLAVVHCALNRLDESFAALNRAIELSGDVARNQAKLDQRIERLRADPRFRAIVGN